jgi:O-antigen chain-terminating methyltransferase
MDGIYLDTVEIRDEEIDVEEIMRKIKENIRARKQQGDLPECKLDEICRQDDGEPYDVVPSNTKDIQKELDQIGSHWDIRNRNFAISSHRPVVGRVMVKGRQVVNGEICRYVDPIVARQIEFNSSVVNILNEMTRRTDELKISKEDAKDVISDVKPILDGQIEALRDETERKLNDHLKEQLDQVKAVVDAMNEEVENRAWLAGLLEKRINSSRANLAASNTAREDDQGINYFVFEERFRGSRIDIKQRQSAFLQFFEHCQAVLDIGCGRGEFLELMQEHGIGARGVDVDKDMVLYCKSKGFQVEDIDAISYLEGIEDKSLDGIFIDQVVEHLEPDYLIKMLSLCYQKLIYGGYILAETVNPLSFFSSVNFYIDMSHKKPIHPETLKFLLGSAGFREIETRFFSPVPDDIRLKKIDAEGAGEKDQKRIEVYNHNIDMLNTILYGAQDYAAIGKK